MPIKTKPMTENQLSHLRKGQKVLLHGHKVHIPHRTTIFRKDSPVELNGWQIPVEGEDP